MTSSRRTVANPLDAYARQVAHRYGLPANVFLALGSRESGRQERRNGQIVTSPAGALGWGQLMPGTAAGLHVDPRNAYQNIEGSARYLRQMLDEFHGNIRLALAAYNAGPGAVKEHGGVPPYRQTIDYVHGILAEAGAFSPGAIAKIASRAATPSDVLPPSSLPNPGVQPDQQSAAQSNDQAALLQGLQMLAQGDYDPSEALGQLLAARQAAASQAPTQATTTSSAAPVASPGPSQSPTAPTRALQHSSVAKWVSLSPSADRAGVPTKHEILGFVANLGRMAGVKLVIGTGSNHNRLTVDGNVSNHWTGDAGDIPATGRKLRRLGYLALRQAGMSEAEARKAQQTGGLFNVGPWQIIFATHEGGNHFNHLHVGYRGESQ